MKVVGICGSIRKDSYNKKLLGLIFRLLEAKGVEVEELLWEDFAPYNQDIEDAGPPQYVVDFKAKIENANGIVFAVPEYNYSLPGAFKNVMDWASRPDTDIPRVFGDRVALSGGVSFGVRGTARAQMHMANLMQDLELIPVPVQVLVSNGEEAFDKQGNLAKESDVQRVEKAVDKMVWMMEKLNR